MISKPKTKESKKQALCSLLDELVVFLVCIKGYFLFAAFSQDNDLLTYSLIGAIGLTVIAKAVYKIFATTISGCDFGFVIGFALAVYLYITDAGQAIEIALSLCLGWITYEKGVAFVAKRVLFWTTAILLIHVILLLSGIISPGEQYVRNGEIRQSYGFKHPNSVAIYALSIILLVHLQVDEKSRGVIVGSTLGSIALTALTYIASSSRSLLILGLLYSALPLWRKLIKKLDSKPIQIAAKLGLPIMLIVNIVLTLLAGDKTSVINVISGNHYLSAYAYLSNGVSLLGGAGYIPSAGSEYAWLQADSEMLPLDNYFILILTQWGILVALIMCLLWWKLIDRVLSKKDYSTAAVLLVALLYGCVSCNPVYSAFSIVSFELTFAYLIYCQGILPLYKLKIGKSIRRITARQGDDSTVIIRSDQRNRSLALWCILLACVSLTVLQFI